MNYSDLPPLLFLTKNHIIFDSQQFSIAFFLQEVVSLQNQAPPSTAPVAAPVAPGAAVVKITGIPASMTGSSIFDCLQQLLGEFTH